MVQMLIILLIARPFEDALHLVQSIAAPMMVTNTVGAALLCASCWMSSDV